MIQVSCTKYLKKISTQGTGKTKTLVSAIEHIIKSTHNNFVLVCAHSNAACDEITERLLDVLSESELHRLYAKSFKRTAVNPRFKNICNLQGEAFHFPPLLQLYKYRVLVCTLLTAGCLVRANTDANFDAKHFSHVIIDESACTHETVSLIPIAGKCQHSLNSM